MRAINETLVGDELVKAMREAGQNIDSEMKSTFINKHKLLDAKRQELADEREVLMSMEKNDSSENVPLHTARENISRLIIEISTLEASCDSYDSLAAAGGVPTEAGGVCTIGSIVCIQDVKQNVSWIIKLYPSGLGNARIGAISIDTPLGIALTRHTKGETVSCNAPGGDIKYFIKEVL